MQTKKRQSMATAIGLTCVSLLLILIGVDIYPLLTGNNGYQIEQQAWLQVARDEYLAKDVLILAYRPVTFHSQAISDLQVIVPQMIQAQNGFLHGDSSLGLPVPSDEVQQLLVRANDDYQPIITALSIILKSPDAPPDPIQVNIVLNHDYSYAILMAQIATLVQQQAEATALHLIVIKVGLKSTLILVLLIYYFISIHPLFAQAEADEQQRNAHSRGRSGGIDGSTP